MWVESEEEMTAQMQAVVNCFINDHKVIKRARY